MSAALKVSPAEEAEMSDKEYAAYLAAQAEFPTKDPVCLEKENLSYALRRGWIDWFTFFERWKKL
jgi:hypothetical protein